MMTAYNFEWGLEDISKNIIEDCYTSSSSEREEFEIVPETERNTFEIIPQQKVRCLDETQLEICENHFLFGGEIQNDSDSDIEVLTRSTTEAIRASTNKLFSEILLKEALAEKIEDRVDLAETFGDIIKGKVEDNDGSEDKSFNVEIASVNAENDDDSIEILESHVESKNGITEWKNPNNNDSIEIVFSDQADSDNLVETAEDFFTQHYGVIAQDEDFSGIKELFQEEEFVNNDDNQNTEDEVFDDSYENDSFEDESLDFSFKEDELISMKTSTLTIIFCSCVLLGVLVGSSCASLFVYMDYPETLASLKSSTLPSETPSPDSKKSLNISASDLELLLKFGNMKMNISKIWPSSSTSKKDVKIVLQALWSLQEENQNLQATLLEYKEKFKVEKQMNLFWKKELKKDHRKLDVPNKIFDGLMEVRDGKDVGGAGDSVDTIIENVVNFPNVLPAVQNDSERISYLEGKLSNEKKKTEFWKQKFSTLNQSKNSELKFDLTSCLDLLSQVLPEFDFSLKFENLSKPVEKIKKRVHSVWNKFKNGWKKEDGKNEQRIKNANKLIKAFNSIVMVTKPDKQYCSTGDFEHFQQRWKNTVTYPKPAYDRKVTLKTYICETNTYIELKIENPKQFENALQLECQKHRKCKKNEMFGPSPKQCKWRPIKESGKAFLEFHNGQEKTVVQRNRKNVGKVNVDQTITLYNCEKHTFTDVVDKGYRDMVSQPTSECKAPSCEKMIDKCSVYTMEEIIEKEQDAVVDLDKQEEIVSTSNQDESAEKSNNKLVRVISCGENVFIEDLDEEIVSDACENNRDCGFTLILNDRNANKCVNYQNVEDVYFEMINDKLRKIRRKKRIQQDPTNMQNEKIAYYNCSSNAYMKIINAEYPAMVTLLDEECQNQKISNNNPLSRMTKDNHKMKEKISNKKEKNQIYSCNLHKFDEFLKDGQDWYEKKMYEMRFRFDIDKWKMNAKVQKIINKLNKEIAILHQDEEGLSKQLKASKVYLKEQNEKHRKIVENLKQVVKKQKHKLDEWKFKEKLQMKAYIKDLQKRLKKEKSKYERNLEKAEKLFKMRLQKAYKNFTENKKEKRKENNKTVKKIADYRTKYQLLEMELKQTHSKYEQLLKEHVKTEKATSYDDEGDHTEKIHWQFPSVFCPKADQCDETTKQHQENADIKRTIFDIARIYTEKNTTPIPGKPIPPERLIHSSVSPSKQNHKQSMFESEVKPDLPIRPSPPKQTSRSEINITSEDEMAVPLSWYIYWGRQRETYNIYDDDIDESIYNDDIPMDWYFKRGQSRDQVRRQYNSDISTSEKNVFLKLMKEREKQRNDDVPLSWYLWIKERRHHFFDEDMTDDNTYIIKGGDN